MTSTANQELRSTDPDRLIHNDNLRTDWSITKICAHSFKWIHKLLHYLSHISWENQKSGMCAQWRLRSALASAQSDQSLRCVLNRYLKTQALFMQTAKTLIRLGGCSGWSESSLGAQSFVGFVMRRLICHHPLWSSDQRTGLLIKTSWVPIPAALFFF